MNIGRRLRSFRTSETRAPGLSFSRPLVLLQSDDWGRVGVRDQEGYAQLRASGIRLGENPYDLYSLETAEDVLALQDLLKRHRDSTGRAACMVMNFLLANLDFPRMSDGNLAELHLKPLSEGLPGHWQQPRPGLFDAYREGIGSGVFHPALHGLTHFCRVAVERALAGRENRAELLRTLWKAETPYIYWRMPWIGYEYCDPENSRFLDAAIQGRLVREAVTNFCELFATPPLSACAPGYRANRDTHLAWTACGVRVAQHGGGPARAPHMDSCEMLNLYRTIDFEPAHQNLPVEEYLRLADDALSRGLPAVVSVHSINFHSSLNDFRTPTLKTLDLLLTALEAKYPDLLYVHDGDLYEIVTRGKFAGPRGVISINVRQSDCAASSAAVAGAS